MVELEAAYCFGSCSALRMSTNKYSSFVPLLLKLALSWQTWCAVQAQTSNHIFVTLNQGLLHCISHAAHGQLLTYRLREVLIEVLV